MFVFFDTYSTSLLSHLDETLQRLRFVVLRHNSGSLHTNIIVEHRTFIRERTHILKCFFIFFYRLLLLDVGLDRSTCLRWSLGTTIFVESFSSFFNTTSASAISAHEVSFILQLCQTTFLFRRSPSRCCWRLHAASIFDDTPSSSELHTRLFHLLYLSSKSSSTAVLLTGAGSDEHSQCRRVRV